MLSIPDDVSLAHCVLDMLPEPLKVAAPEGELHVDGDDAAESDAPPERDAFIDRDAALLGDERPLLVMQAVSEDDTDELAQPVTLLVHMRDTEPHADADTEALTEEERDGEREGKAVGVRAKEGEPVAERGGDREPVAHSEIEAVDDSDVQPLGVLDDDIDVDALSLTEALELTHTDTVLLLSTEDDENAEIEGDVESLHIALLDSDCDAETDAAPVALARVVSETDAVADKLAVTEALPQCVA